MAKLARTLGEVTCGTLLAHAAAMARLGFGALLMFLVCMVTGFSTTGCFLSCDECEPDTLVELTSLPASLSEPVSVELRHVGDAAARIRCQSSVAPGRNPTWDCDGSDKSNSGAFSFAVENGRDKWLVHLEGPSGTSDFEREPKSTDPGEGWPTSCPCFPYTIYVSHDDFNKVGVSWE